MTEPKYSYLKEDSSALESSEIALPETLEDCHGVQTSNEAELGGHQGGCFQPEDSKILIFQMRSSQRIEKHVY